MHVLTLCDWFILLLLLPTPTTWFSLDHKRNVSGGAISGIGTRFSQDHKIYASDYDSDSDSVAGEKPALKEFLLTGSTRDSVKNSRSYVYVLHETYFHWACSGRQKTVLKSVITCRAVVFLIKPIVFWRCRCRPCSGGSWHCAQTTSETY